jgi:hypothetical protein
MRNPSQCPHCGERTVRPSRSHGIADGIMMAFHKHPFRCGYCKGRFYSRVGSLPTLAAVRVKFAPPDLGEKEPQLVRWPK